MSRAPSARGGGPSPGPGGQQNVQRSTCKYCKRQFADDRLQMHMNICRETYNSKRPQYDATKHRLDLFVPERDIKKFANARKPPPRLSKIPWRDAHNDWSGNNTPQSARPTASARGAAGGQQSAGMRGTASRSPAAAGGGPPDDRIPCPGCGRRFNKTAAEKHIPYCVERKKK